jgi:hypothetical protein
MMYVKINFRKCIILYLFFIFIVTVCVPSNSFAAAEKYSSDEKLFTNKGTIKISLSNPKIEVGKTSQLKVTLTLKPNKSKAKITYSLGNNKLVSINNNIIKGISPGKTYIKATYLGKSAIVNIQIQPAKTSISQAVTSISQTVSEKQKSTLTLTTSSDGYIIISNYTEFTDAIKNALSNSAEKVSLKIKDYDPDSYNVSDTIDKILTDDPSVSFGYDGGSITTFEDEDGTNIKIVEILFRYDSNLYKTNKYISDMNIAADKKAKEIVNSLIKPSMTDVQKELVLHDYLVNNAKYDSENFNADTIPESSYNAYGVLINGVGVCQSYADAMNKLLTLVGIESTVISGTANNGSEDIDHAWNIVKLDGQYYNLDVTWDDPVTSDGRNILSHSYFNLTDAQISKNHSWDKSKYPKCTGTKYSFSSLNIPEKDWEGDEILVINDYNTFYKSIENAVTNSNKNISLKINNYDKNLYDLSQTLQKIIDSDDINNISGYKTSISTDGLDSNIKYLKIYFSYR